MKQWLIALIAGALVGGAVTAQDVKTKSGGIIVKKVIKNGKVVDENVEVFGDLDDEDVKRHLGRLKKSKKSARKGDGKKRMRVYRWKSDDDEDFDFDFDFDLNVNGKDLGGMIRKEVQKALKGLGKDLGSEMEVVIRGLGKNLHGHMGKALEKLEDLDVDIDLGDLEKHMKGMKFKLHDAKKAWGKAFKRLDKGGFHWKFGDNEIRIEPGRLHLFSDGLDEEIKAKLEGLHGKDHDVQIWLKKDGDKPSKLSKAIRKHLRSKSTAKSTTQKKAKKTKRYQLRRSDRDAGDAGDATIRRLQRQIRDLQKELDALRRRTERTAKKTVWL